MKKTFSKLFVLLLLCSSTLFAQQVDLCKIMDTEGVHGKIKYNTKSAPQTAEYDVSFYRLDLSLNPMMRFFSGSVTTYFTPKQNNLNRIVFDFNNQMVIDSVKYHNQPIPYSTMGFKIVEANFPSPIPANTLDSITIYYKGSPNGSATSRPFARVDIPGGDLIWTLSQPYGAQEWWPCKNDLTDKADSVEINVTTPQQYKVATNGLLQSLDTIGTDHIYRYKTTYPTVAYLIAINVGDYDFYQEYYPLNGDSILMEHYLYSNETLSQSSSFMLDFMTFFDSLLGPYPFIKEKYGHMSFTFGGGMEHQTISSMGGYGGELKAHELAHQWFGDKVTCGSWSDLWLNEGFATYLTGLTYEFSVAHDIRFWPVWKNNAEVGSFNFPHGSVYRFGTDTNVVSTLFNGQVYNKGAITLHTLRWFIGDSAFFAGTRNYINDSNLEYGFATTPDLQTHYELASGMNLDEFFNDWIYGRGYPVFNSYWKQTGSNFTLRVEQIPTDSSVSFFEIPVPYKLVGINWDTSIVVNPTTNIQSFNLPINQRIVSIELDADNVIFAQEGITTGLNSKQEIENQFKIYPNPTNNSLQLNYPEAIQLRSIQVFDNQGQLILESNSEQTIDVSQFPNGIYFLKVNSNLGIIQKKFQKVN